MHHSVVSTCRVRHFGYRRAFGDTSETLRGLTIRHACVPTARPAHNIARLESRKLNVLFQITAPYADMTARSAVGFPARDSRRAVL